MNTFSRTVPAASAQTNTPSAAEPDVAFLEAAYATIDDALMNADTQMSAEAATYASNDLRDWMLSVMPSRPQRWAGHRRVLTALLDGFERDLVVFNCSEDFQHLQSALMLDASFFPSIMEHFISAGELFRLLDITTSNTVLLSARSDETDEPESIALSGCRLRLLRIYLHDRDQADTAEDAEHPLFPLELRLGLSGFYDELTEKEFDWDYAVRSTKQWESASEDSILDSFAELSAQRREDISQ